jgi:hypothetical protein
MKYIQLNDSNIKEGLLNRRICINCENVLKINHNNKYFYQLQQQMFVTQRKWTDFVVKGSMSDELYIERVYFDCDFWSLVLPKLCRFFEHYMLPEMAYPRIKNGLPRFDLSAE